MTRTPTVPTLFQILLFLAAFLVASPLRADITLTISPVGNDLLFELNGSLDLSVFLRTPDKDFQLEADSFTTVFLAPAPLAPQQCCVLG